MSKKFVLHKENYLANLKFDIPAGLVVFLVAVPLCLGIALASGAPFTAGILAGIIGGLIVPIISQSQLSVSGPAAGLTAVVLSGIEKLETFEVFLVAVFLAGILQIVLGIIRAGVIAYFFPSSVIKGMLAAIGLILILKQIPHAVGYDLELFGLDKFEVGQGENTLTLFFHSLDHIEWGALIVSAISLIILIFWDKIPLVKKLRIIPAALIVVILGAVLNKLFMNFLPNLTLGSDHLVSIPVPESPKDFFSSFSLPNWSFLFNKDVWVIGITIGLIASLETLLTIEAVDKLDPYKRKSPLNRELIAQGIGNSIAGLIGALPITSVIVRSSANINSGGRTKMAAVFHGAFILISVVFFASYLNLVPLASLASILLVVGFKLTKPSLFKERLKSGFDQFAPFIATIIAILLTDLLIGISIGIVIGLIFVIRTNFHNPITVTKDKKFILIKFNQDISFLHKAIINKELESIEENSHVIVDAHNAQFIDNDIRELLSEFKKESQLKNITFEYNNFKKTIRNSKKNKSDINLSTVENTDA